MIYLKRILTVFIVNIFFIHFYFLFKPLIIFLSARSNILCIFQTDIFSSYRFSRVKANAL